jgi:hypothetical protein
MPRSKKSHREAAYYRKQAADHMRAARRENSEEKRIQLENVAKGFQNLAANEQWLAGDDCQLSGRIHRDRCSEFGGHRSVTLNQCCFRRVPEPFPPPCINSEHAGAAT